MAAIIVASLLWLPSDCTGRTAALDTGPAEVAPVTALEVASTTVAEAAEEETVTATAATTMTTGRKSATGQFSVQMLLPFSKSTIRYSYTELTASGSSARISAQTEDVDQAHSMSVSSYGCGAVTVGGGCGDDGGQRKRKRVRWKTTALPGAAENDQSVGVTTRVQTNTIVPLPGYPTADSGRGAVFEAAAEQLDQLYTVSRVAGTVSGSGGDAEAISEDGTTDAVETVP